MTHEDITNEEMTYARAWCISCNTERTLSLPIKRNPNTQSVWWTMQMPCRECQVANATFTCWSGGA